MVITLNTKELEEYNLTPNEFVLLYSMRFSSFIKYKEEDLKELIKKGFIREHDLSVTDLGLELLSPEFNDAWEQAFLKFWNTYPHIVGTRVLKTEKSNTRLANDCRKRFKKSCYNKIENASILINSLKNQIKLLSNTPSFSYFQTIEAWLNQNTWEKYITIQENDERINLI